MASSITAVFRPKAKPDQAAATVLRLFSWHRIALAILAYTYRPILSIMEACSPKPVLQLIPMKLIQISTSCPNQALAEQIGSGLINQGLAACVQIFPGIRSIYHWQGKLEQADEVVLHIKTIYSRFDEIKSYILSQHSYELPEIVAVEICAALPAYADWLQSQSQSK